MGVGENQQMPSQPPDSRARGHVSHPTETKHLLRFCTTVTELLTGSIFWNFEHNFDGKFRNAQRFSIKCREICPQICRRSPLVYRGIVSFHSRTTHLDLNEYLDFLNRVHLCVGWHRMLDLHGHRLCSLCSAVFTNFSASLTEIVGSLKNPVWVRRGIVSFHPLSSMAGQNK